jgi:hypothetical protein
VSLPTYGLRKQPHLWIDSGGSPLQLTSDAIIVEVVNVFMLVTPLTVSDPDMWLECEARHLAQLSFVTRFNAKPLIALLADAVTNVAKKIEIFETDIDY